MLQTIDEIKSDMGNSPFWLSIDETTDKCGRMIVNVVVGKLSSNDAGVPHLILSKEVEVTNHSVIVRLVRDALSK